MTQKELSKLLHDIDCPVNEGVSSLKNEKVFPRIDYWEIMWEDTMASGDDYENEITLQKSRRSVRYCLRIWILTPQHLEQCA